MEVDDKFQKLITTLTAVLHNYLYIAKQSGTITINVDAVKGDVVKVEVINRLRLNVDGLNDGKTTPPA